MKKILMFLAAGFLFAASACADDRPVTVAQLPAAAQQFLTKYFPGQSVAIATYDPDFFSATYEVMYSNGAKVEFDSKGNLKEYYNPISSVPEEILPAGVADFVKQTYPDALIIELDIDSRGCDVKLSNRVEISFNTQGQAVDIDFDD